MSGRRRMQYPAPARPELDRLVDASIKARKGFVQMSVFFRLCPADCHTCADRECLINPRDPERCPKQIDNPATPKQDRSGMGKPKRGWDFVPDQGDF